MFKSFKVLLALIFLASPSFAEDTVRTNSKVIMLIGDGMGTGQLGLLNMAWEFGRKRGLVPDRENSYSELVKNGKISLISTKPAKYIVPDSACAASSISTGKNCLPETLGLDEEGNQVQVFSEFARDKKITVGLISDTRLTHATPAGFYARSLSRNSESEIAKQFVNSSIDLGLSGGSKFFKSSENASFDLTEIAKEKGYNFVEDKKSLNNLDKLPVLGLFGELAMPDAIESKHRYEIPTLVEMTQKALELFKNKDSFFLMVEAGQIDWAAHQNDPGLLLHEMIRFEQVLNYLHEHIRENPSVTLMVLSDHETGGFGFSYQVGNQLKVKKEKPNFVGYDPSKDFVPDEVLEELFSQKISYRNVAVKLNHVRYDRSESIKIIQDDLKITPSSELMDAIENLNRSPKRLSLANEYHEKHTFYAHDDDIDAVVLSKYLSRQLSVVWSTGTHTVPLIPFIIEGNNRDNYKNPQSLVEVGKLLREVYN